MTRRALRTVGDGGVVICPQAGNRVFPREAPVASMKLKPEGVPRHLGQQDVSAYFPHGETAVTEILEGQLAFLQHVHLCEENHRGTHILQPRLLWKYEFLCCFLGCLSSTDLEGLTQEIDDISSFATTIAAGRSGHPRRYLQPCVTTTISRLDAIWKRP